MKEKILIVDDEANILKSTSLILESLGYDIDIAFDGLEAIEKVKINSYDLLLLDIMMPGIDGWETLAEIRKLKSPAELPVIIFTAKEVLNLDELCQKNQAQSTLTKPFNPIKLSETLDEFFHSQN